MKKAINKLTIFELVSEIKKQEQSELIEAIKTYGTSKTDGSITYVFEDESPIVAGYSYDEPSDLVITQVGVTPKGHLFIVGTEKNVGFVPQNIQPDDIFAGHIDVITSEIIARAKVKVQDLIASQIPGADVKEIERWANVMMSNIASDKLIEEIEKTDFTSLASCDYKPGQKVWLYPFNEDDFQREVTIIKFDNEDNILVTDDKQITQEVVLCELYRKSEKVCPKCGNTIYHEKYSNTEDKYPYVCFGCNENFFEFEINPLLK